MTNEISTINQSELDAFLAKHSISQDSLNNTSDFLPQLKVNYMDEITIDGKKYDLKPGLFTLGGQEVASYAKNVKFRPLLQTFQYIDYDKDKEEVVNRSVLFNDFSDEARDETGTLRCGKPTSKVLNQEGNAALKKAWAHVSLYRSIDGIVSYTGVDAAGNEVKVENVLCTYRGKGASFSPFQEEYTQLLPKGTMMWDFELTLSTTKHKQDPKSAVNYYVTHFEADFSKRLSFTGDLFDTVKELARRIEATNKEIDKKYYAAAAARTETDTLSKAIDITPNTHSLDSDFETDETIPF